MNRNRTILILFATLLLMTVAGELLLSLFFNGYTGKAHLSVPLFFLVIYAMPILLLPQPTDTKQFVKQLLIFKPVKLILSLGTMVGLCLVFREQAKGVLVNFLIYSLVMIAVENIYVLSLKRHIVKST